MVRVIKGGMMKKTTAALAILGGISMGCITPHYIEGEWPNGMPPQSYYETIYQTDEDNKNLQGKQEYMTWIIRFYEGYGMFGGWKNMTESLLKAVPNHERQMLGARLAFIGQMVSGEWCKANKVRRIDADMLKLWANLLSKSKKKRLICNTAEVILADVTAILSDQLRSTEISVKRYKAILQATEMTTATH